MNLPLLELYKSPLINRVSEFAEITKNLDVSALIVKYKELIKSAPRRHQAGKEYFVRHKTFIGGNAKSNRKEEHLAGALFNKYRISESLKLPDGKKMKIIDYQFPLKAIRGNKGVGKIDLIGVIEDRDLCVIELKVGQDSGDKSDTPLRAILEGLAYCAIVEANMKEIISEAKGKFDLDLNENRLRLIIMAPEKYWSYYKNKRAAGNWAVPIKKFIRELSGQIPINISVLSLVNSEFEWATHQKPARITAPIKVLSIL